MDWVLGGVVVAVWVYLAGILVVWGLVGLLVLAACALVVGAAVYVVGCGVVGFTLGLREGRIRIRERGGLG